MKPSLSNIVIIIGIITLTGCANLSTPTVATPDSKTQSITQYPVERALTNIYINDLQYTLQRLPSNENSDGNITIEFKQTAGNATEFEDHAVLTTKLQNVDKIDNHIDSVFDWNEYYTLSPLTLYGYITEEGRYGVTEQYEPLPALVSLGDTQLWFIETTYDDSSKSTVLEKAKTTWSLAPATTNTAWLCIEYEYKDVDTVMYTDKDTECFEINTQGDILDIKMDYGEFGQFRLQPTSLIQDVNDFITEPVF